MSKIDPEREINLVMGLVRGMVEFPQHLDVQSGVGETAVEVSLRAHGVDSSKLIGKSGVIHRALVAVAEELGNQAGYRLRYGYLREPVEGRQLKFGGLKTEHRFTAKENWNAEKIGPVMLAVLKALFANVRVCRIDLEEAHSSTYEILIPDHSKRDKGYVLDALAKLYDAIGRANGRLIALEFVAMKEEAEEKQPESPRGRYA